MQSVEQIINTCEWAPSKLLIFSDNVFAPFIYYSHLSALAIGLVVGLFVFLSGRKNLVNNVLFAAMLFFAGWIFADLVLWATEFPKYTMFFWALINLFEPFVYFFTFYFVYVFLKDRDLGLKSKIVAFLPMIPIILLTPTSAAIIGYDLTNCDRAAVEGFMAFYGYIVEIIYLLAAVVVIFKHIQTNKADATKSYLLLVGVAFFLLSFSLGNIVESITENWYIGQIGLIGAPIFGGLLAYLIVRYQSFHIKLIAAQALVAGLWVLVLSLLFIRTIENIRIVLVATMVLLTVLGYQLIKSVKTEVKQREELAVANAGQENLIHIMNHQIKGYLTKARNIFAELKSEPDYCAGEEAKPMLEEGFKSATDGVEFVQQVLQGSSASSGKLVYNLMPLDFRTLVLDTAEKQRGVATDKQLTLDIKADAEPINIKADDIQLKEAVRNLIDNSIRYTQTGGLTVTVNKKAGKALLTVKDTGVGIADEDKLKLFQKGGRGKDSLKYNVNSTGYGLAFVKGVVDAHKGRVWAESAGPGKGSTFYMELPLA